MPHVFHIHILSIFLIVAASCQSGTNTSSSGPALKSEQLKLANQLEESLFEFILDPWYPRNIDTLGGYISAFNKDWSLSEGSQDKALVQQARHLWATSYVLEHYPDSLQFMDYANHGFRFLK